MPDPMCEAMSEALAWSRDHGLSPRQLTRYQLKFPTGVSYYPGKGTIFIDGAERALPDRGLDALADLLRKRGVPITASLPQSGPLSEYTLEEFPTAPPANSGHHR